jgi:hypothetical protein
MITVDLTQQEFVVLKQILENKATALVNEIAHTDDRAYRKYLRETSATVESLQAKVDAGLTQGMQQHA